MQRRRLLTVQLEDDLTIADAERIGAAVASARRTGMPLILGAGATIRTHDLGARPTHARAEQAAVAGRGRLIRRRKGEAAAARHRRQIAAARAALIDWHRSERGQSVTYR